MNTLEVLTLLLVIFALLWKAIHKRYLHTLTITIKSKAAISYGK